MVYLDAEMPLLSFAKPLGFRVSESDSLVLRVALGGKRADSCPVSHLLLTMGYEPVEEPMRRLAVVPLHGHAMRAGVSRR